MCGVCGVLNYDRSRIHEDLLMRMCQTMRHRGPDDVGVYVDNSVSGPCVGLGHRRLRIIDLSQAGHQPMSNEDKTVWIVFNGEIYNFNELRDELLKKNHFFKSCTDTECVIHLYEEYGEECVKRLHGMFAFAVWDRKNETFLMARDRVGKKPILYYHKGNRFCFASEFCALLENNFISREINLESIDYYLTFGYIPAPLTIYNNVFKLPPAHTLVIKNNTLKVKKYWELNYKDKIKISEQEAAFEVLRLLKEAVKVRLVSDVPLGAFLSGGIDSSAVVALMSQLSANKAKTFSIGFDDADYNELKYAKNIATRFGTEHREFIVKPKALDILPLLVERFGEPYADSSCIPTYYVAQQTKRHVTVALSGDGGDELFAGYERYQAMLAAQIIPDKTKKMFGGLSAMLPDSINFRSRLRRIKRFFSGAVLPAQPRYLKWIGIFDDNLKKSIYSQDLMNFFYQANTLNFIKPFFNSSSGLSLIDTLLFTDTMTYLPNDLLVKVDIATMANSLEARSPFLDQKLMEFAAKLPAEYKMKNFIKKYILKKAIKNLVPPENIYRKKMGFGVPIGNWFRNDLKNLLSETILSKASLGRGYFKPDALKNMLRLHVEEKADYSFQLWSLLMLELWHKRFID